MERRQQRREVLFHLAVMEEQRDKLLQLAADADTGGDPILAGELRKYTDRLTVTLDDLYVWAGNL